MGLTLLDLVANFGLEDSAALQVEFGFADLDDVATFPALPDISTQTTNAQTVDLAAAVLVFKSGKCFKKFRGSLEANSFDSTLEGPNGAKSFVNKLMIARNQVNKELIGYVRSNRNRQLIVAFKPLAGGQYILLGWEGIPAEIVGGGFKIAPEVSGETKTNLEIRSIYLPPLYINTISFTPAV